MTRLTLEERHYIQAVSHHKLVQYHHSRVDLSIRKYVLIANMLRHQSAAVVEQHIPLSPPSPPSPPALERDDEEEEEGERMAQGSESPEAERWLDFVLNDLDDMEEEEGELFESMDYTYDDGYELERTVSRLPSESSKSDKGHLSTDDESSIRRLYPIEEESMVHPHWRR
ncbi:hypothetical protein EC973_004460 [Apophysomyces ossiformis]|uniref:SERTA domain-containing protein n=1 Tax=Apophysomyces ossiformis TaxID=679940 RepID=A0A8H7EKJ6_9FUNG|nr:hypothetical protein EC973_004460 [Apophysomyces ossiformis]